MVRKRALDWQRVHEAENSWLLALPQKRTAIHHHTPDSQHTPVRRDEGTVLLLPAETVQTMAHGG